MFSMNVEELIQNCARNDRECQHAVFEQYRDSMAGLCMRYAKNAEEAHAICINGFKNIFSGIKKFSNDLLKSKETDVTTAFEQWIHKEMIASAIHHMLEARKREFFVSSTFSTRDQNIRTEKEVSDTKIMEKASKTMIIRALQELTPSYRAVYNMYEIDGFSHADISRMLDISEYSSKDTLSKARFMLRKNLAKLIPN